MAKFMCQSGSRNIPKDRPNQWDAKYDSTYLPYWQVTWVRIYDLCLWFSPESKLWIVIDHSDGFAAKGQWDYKEIHEWAKGNIPLYRAARGMSRAELREEVQTRLGKRALEYLSRVMMGQADYSGD